jgi:predicted Zn-dependent peptidase
MAFKGTETIGTKSFRKEKPLLNRLEEIAAESNGGTTLNAEQKKEWNDIHRALEELTVNNDFFAQYEARGASSMNASTSADSTDYFNNFPRESFEFWCKMESERLISPVMRQFYKERDVVMEERRSRFEDSPDGKLYERFLGTAFSVHPYRNPVIGYEEDIRTVTAREVAEYHRRFYVPRNIVISLVGDVDPARDMPVIRRYFGALKDAPLPKRLRYQEPSQLGERRLELAIDASPTVMIGYHKPAYPHPDDPPISLAAELLSSGSLAPLYENLVKKQRVAASVGHEEAPGTVQAGLSVFVLTPQSPHSGEDVLRAFDASVKGFLRAPPAVADLERAKRMLATAYLKELRSNLGLAKGLAHSELLFGDWRTGLKWFEEAMAVTPEALIRAARTYFVPENRTVGMLTPKNSTAPQWKAATEKAG